MSRLEQAVDGPGVYCTFWLDRHCFGVPSWTIREVHKAVALTPVPGTSDSIRGYVNLRGQLYLVLNPDGLLLGQQATKDRHRDLIVFRPEVGESFAIEVDAIGDITIISEADYHSQIEDQSARNSGGSLAQGPRIGLVRGHATLSDQLVTLVDPHQFPILGMTPP